MKKSIPSVHLISMILIFSGLTISNVCSQIERPIGSNLAGVVDWSSEFVFVDVMKQSRTWTPHSLEANAEWDSGVEIPLRDDGYPMSIPYDNGVDPPQGVRAIMFADLENVFPAGQYRFIAEGVGTIQLWGAASLALQCPIDTIVELDNSSGILALEILESSFNDPINGIHLVMPGYHDTFESNPFHPELLSFIEDFQVIRFMDWMSTNGSEVVEWSDRNLPSSITQTTANGVSYEYLIEISNLTQKDLWVNIPHKASDDFIIQFATMLRDQVDSGLKIYLEYSNEVWNNIFSQNVYAAEAAEAVGYTGEPWDLSWQYTAKRSADVFQLFEDVFVDHNRLVKVLPGIAVNSWVNNFIIDRFSESEYNPTGVTADALAIAPYFGGVANSIGDAGLANTITVEEILDSMEMSLPESFLWMDENKQLADDTGLDLIAYEGGQHLVAYFPYDNNQAFVDKLLEVNRHPRMEELYCAYFDYWYDTVEGGVFASFSSHGGYSQFGSWGVKETYEDVNAPKYLGLKNCVFSYNTVSNVGEVLGENVGLKLYPSLVRDQLNIESSLDNFTVAIYDLNGVLHNRINSENSFVTLSTAQLPSGIYFVHISNESSNNLSVSKIVKQ